MQAPVVALEHLRVIDGTGGMPTSDQTILISGDKIEAIGGSASVEFRRMQAASTFPDIRQFLGSWECTTISSM